MWKPKHLLLLLSFLVLLQINAISTEKLPQNIAVDDVRRNSQPHSGEHSGRNVLLKRQSGSFGFQHNSLPTTGDNYYPVSGRYDPVRSNGLLNSNSLRNGDRDRDYYPAAYPTSGRSSGGIGGGYYSYNRERDDYRDRNDYRGNDRGDYRGSDRDRPPYYDDYRYNGYHDARDREAAAAQTMEFVMRNGQQRHAEYQKRIGHSGQESYDPFYFIGLRAKQGGVIDGPLPLSPGGAGGLLSGGSLSSSFPPPPAPSSSGNGLLSPTSTTSTGPNGPNSNLSPPSSPSAPASHPLRNRRNSHSKRHPHPNDFYSNELISGDKYELMSGKMAYPSHMMLIQRNRNNDHPPHVHHRWTNHHLDQQFLTREQLVRHPDSRVQYPQHNHIDRYGPTITSALGQPWSVRIGTQLKVNDDGRSPNPTRFYVRDEINPGRNRSRYPGPIYRRK